LKRREGGEKEKEKKKSLQKGKKGRPWEKTLATPPLGLFEGEGGGEKKKKILRKLPTSQPERKRGR